MTNFIYRILILLGIIKIPKYDEKYAKIDGSVLFVNEYNNNYELYRQMYQALRKQCSDVFIRIPVPVSNWNLFRQTVETAEHAKINSLALMDTFFNDSSFQNRLNFIKNELPNIKYFELFNELPRMEYEGTKFDSAQMLIDKTNQYSDWIHQNVKDSKVASMAPHNSLDDEYYNDWKIGSKDLLKKLILETRTDIIAIHCYVMNTKSEVGFSKLVKDLAEWLPAAKEKFGYDKVVWITETGDEDWDEHIKTYQEWTSRYVEHLYADKVFWYRQSIDKKSSLDGGFAFDVRETGEKSPLYKMLLN